MGFLKKISQAISGTRQSDPDGYIVYVRCAHCREKLQTRVNLKNDLSLQYGEGNEGNTYYCRKLISGAALCFRRIEVNLTFDTNKKLIDRQITGGEFISEEEFNLSADTQDNN